MVGIATDGPEVSYSLFMGGKVVTYYESQLRSAPPQGHVQQVGGDEFRARLTASQIRHPSLDSLYSLQASRITFVPYQFRPVMRFIRSDRPRLLVADEVGVGKTIEAGLILRELQARRNIRTVMIICPKALVAERKWQLELERFDEHFEHLDGPTLRNCIAEYARNGVWPERYSRCIIPFSLFDERLLEGSGSEGGLLGLDPPPIFDLVVVDEAHHLRNRATQLHQGVRHLVSNAEAAVFLSATPIQLRSNDLFVLLNLLRPDVVIDPATFALMSEPNTHIHAAANAVRSASDHWQALAVQCLTDAASTDWGLRFLARDPDFSITLGELTQDTLDDEARIPVLRRIEELHTFSRLINRTRRRDIGSFTTRKPFAIRIAFTPEQENLHDELLAAQARILAAAHGDRSVRFMLSTLRRQASSCIHALAPMVQTILNRRLDEIDFDLEDDWEDEEAAVGTIRDHVQTVVDLASALGPEDPKLSALLRIVEEKQVMVNNKILLFSSFRHTLAYLLRNLQSLGVRTGLVQGDVSDDERRNLRRRFSLDRTNPQAIDLLLSSEVGCEGLDYQFCDTLLNYDLPWNPMRIEQRIGRIDRYGQPSETVAIYNLITEGTVDYEVYDRCFDRIGVFRQALGGSEEVLGAITEELQSVAIALELTEDERSERLRQIADNAVRLLHEQTALENQQAQLFGLTLPPDQIENEVQEATSPWLSPRSLLNLVNEYLAQRCGPTARLAGGGPTFTLRVSQENRSVLLADYQRIPRVASAMNRSWERYLRGSEARLSITIDTQVAVTDREIVLLNPVHPLVKQAAESIYSEAPFAMSAVVTDPELPNGRYPFAVYLWTRSGIREDSQIVCVCPDDSVQHRLPQLLQEPQVRFDPGLPLDGAETALLESKHHGMWRTARELHIQRTHEIAQYRISSLQASHDAGQAAIVDQLNAASNDRIRIMRERQMANLVTDTDRARRRIEEDAGRGEIASHLLAQGSVVVERRS